MPIRSTASPILRDGRGSTAINRLIEGLRTQKSASGPMVAEAIASLANGQNAVTRALREPSPVPEEIVVVDSTGKPIMWVGDRPPYRGAWAQEIYIGGDGPATAPFFASGNGDVIIGKNGSVLVEDQFGGAAAWVGAEFDTLAVTAYANNGSDGIRLTVTGHPFSTGDTVLVMGMGRYADGEWTITVIDGNHFDLAGSLYGTSTLGSVARLLHVTGAANNGDGLIRLTVTAHGYESGDRVNVLGVGGVPNSTGQWTVEVNDANTFDLVGSTWGGGYTSGGTCVRYFGGVQAQTFAVGDSFANYKLRAFADGTLRIKDATITLDGSAALIELDPDEGVIRVTGKNTYNVIVEMSSLGASGTPAGIIVRNGAESRDYTWVGYDSFGIVEHSSLGGEFLAAAYQGASIRLWSDYLGYQTVYIDGATGRATFDGNLRAYDLIIDETTVIDHSRSGTLNSLSLTTPLVVSSGGTGSGTASGARTNLSVYSKAEVYTKTEIDALLAVKANTGTYPVSGGGGGSVTI